MLVSTGVFSRWMPFACAMFAGGSTCPSASSNGSRVAKSVDCLFLLPVLRRKTHVVAIDRSGCSGQWANVPGVMSSSMPRDFGRTRSAGTATADRGFVLMSQDEVESLLQKDLTFRIMDNDSLTLCQQLKKACES